MVWNQESNMRLKKIIIVLLIGLLSPILAIAQQQSDEGRGGSPYSVFGLGLPQEITSDNFKAQGITGVSGISQEMTSLSNPALWYRSYFTQAFTGLSLSKYKLKDNSGSEENGNFGSGYLHVLFPLAPGKLGLSVSLYPVTRSSYRLLDGGTFLASPTDTVAFSNEITRSGGVNKFEIGFGLKLTKNISVGYAPSVAFMTLENNESLFFSSGSFNAQDQSINNTGVAFSQRFGISALFSNVFRGTDRIALGATINVPYNIGTKSSFKVQKSIGGIEQELDYTSSLSVSEGDIQIPLDASFGLGYAPSPLVNFAVEGTFQKWSDFTNELDRTEEGFMKDRMKIGFGGQFHPYKRNADSFFSRFKYSGGLSYDTGHLTIQGNDISTLWINTGLGILSRSSSSIDISFRYGFRGTTNNNLIKEQIWALGFSVNLTELMFIRPKLR